MQLVTRFENIKMSQPSDKIPARTMKTAGSEIVLERVPANPNLQAWDAADQYLLRHIKDNEILHPDSEIIILNDQFAALTVALADYSPCMISDSYLSKLALRHNMALNGRATDQLRFCSGLQSPESKFNLVLIKIHRSLALLEHQLHAIRPLINEHSTVIAAGMTRHIHSSTLALFENILGPTRTTLAWKKSRLILVEANQALEPGQSPYPDEFIVNVGQDLTISNHASLFSRDKLDAGTRLLLEQMPISDSYQTIIDLGCGNGILGLVAALLNPDAVLIFVDESYMAVDSARTNFQHAFGDSRSADFKVTNCLQGIDSESADLVLNNPPFHQQNSIGDAIAWQMFVDAKRVLKTGGEIRVVGNRHLAYHAKLKKIFGNCEQIASNGKYVILNAVKKPA